MPLLDLEQSERVIIGDLEMLIIRQIKKILARDAKQKDSNPRHDLVEAIQLPALMERIGPTKKPGDSSNRTYKLKFYEAIARLKRRRLLMDVVGTPGFPSQPGVCLTSVGEMSDFVDGVLMIIDDAQEIVDKVKEKIPNLDDVVEQYFLESLRTSQEGCYIASVICLGAASERAINCLADAVTKHDECNRNNIETHRQPISKLTQHLLSKFKEYFNQIENQAELRRQLEGMAMIYRLNRNEAGHPSSLPQDWQRDEQECYLNQFRRYVCTVFKAILILENGGQNETGQS